MIDVKRNSDNCITRLKKPKGLTIESKTKQRREVGNIRAPKANTLHVVSE